MVPLVTMDHGMIKVTSGPKIIKSKLVLMPPEMGNSGFLSKRGGKRSKI